MTNLILASVRAAATDLAVNHGVDLADVISGANTNYNHLIIAAVGQLAVDLQQQLNVALPNVIAAVGAAELAQPGGIIPGTPYKVAEIIAYVRSLGFGSGQKNAEKSTVIPGTTQEVTDLIFSSVRAAAVGLLVNHNVQLADILSGAETNYNHVIIAAVGKLAVDLQQQLNVALPNVIAAVGAAELAHPGGILPGTPYRIADLIAFVRSLGLGLPH